MNIDIASYIAIYLMISFIILVIVSMEKKDFNDFIISVSLFWPLYIVRLFVKFVVWIVKDIFGKV
jgi:hypothetical protein